MMVVVGEGSEGSEGMVRMVDIFVLGGGRWFESGIWGVQRKMGSEEGGLCMPKTGIGDVLGR